jgi:glycerol uptake facilitator-like aquaporin
MTFNPSARVVAEFLGTAFLLAAVVGSGIMAERLASGNLAIALLANTLATGAALVALILTLGTISGAHFNPAVTVADALRGGIAWRQAPAYIVAQIAGAFSGVGAAHIMFGLPLFSLSLHARSGGAQLCSEFIATFGLLWVFGDALALGPQQSPLPWELISLRRIGSRLRLHLPIPRLHWPAPPATPLPGFAC